MGFEQGFVGQAHIVKTLQNSLASGRLTHAYLFSGPRGTGKTTTAKIFAKAVNCLSSDQPVAEPCNNCDLCVQVNEGSSMDVIEMDAATNRGIEEVRDLRDRVKYSPALGRFKVYIIDEVHMLTTEAFNALLKTLEEPPSHVIFIMATTEPQKIPATILSRCQRYDFRPLTEGMIARHLIEVAQGSGAELDADAARLLAFRAQGGMRDALGLLEQVISFSEGTISEEQVWGALGTIDKGRLVQLANALNAGEIGPVLALLDEYGGMGVDYRQLLADLLELLRDQLLLVSGAKELGSGSRSELSAKTLSEIMTLMDVVAMGLQDSRRWNHPRLAVELMAVKFCNRGIKPTELHSVPQPQSQIQAQAGTVPAAATIGNITKPKWDEVLALVKKESISSYAWLKEAKAVLGKEGLVLEYPGNYMLHCDNILKGEHRQVIVPVLRQVLGLDQYQAKMKD
jgi:DNA polymerase-3 subunit gamma/tau